MSRASAARTKVSSFAAFVINPGAKTFTDAKCCGAPQIVADGRRGIISVPDRSGLVARGVLARLVPPATRIVPWNGVAVSRGPLPWWRSPDE